MHEVETEVLTHETKSRPVCKMIQDETKTKASEVRGKAEVSGCLEAA